jgi:formylglycine-generating enzyme
LSREAFGEQPASAGDPARPSTACLTDDQALAYVRGGPGGSRPSTEVQEHLDGCAACRVLMAEAARGATLPVLDPDEEEPRRPDQPLTLVVGQVVAGRYRIQRFIARGGMGEVYEAEDSVLRETVALKTLACTSLDSAEAMARFLAEVRLARQVTHANVCRILELGSHRLGGPAPAKDGGHHNDRVSPDEGGPPGESIPFLTMEYLRGETLRQRIRRLGRLPPEEVERLLPQIVAGLSAIHAAGIVHRDIKPHNIMLLEGPPLRVVLTDFGLARALSTTGSTITGRFIVGTNAYMAPEQLEGKPPTAAFDVYAVGIVLFEMLTGRHPFSDAAGFVGLLQRVRQPPRPSEMVPALDPTWDDVVARCLAVNPGDRFDRIEQMLQPARVGSAGRARRQGLLLGLAGAALAVAGIVGGVSLLGSQDRPGRGWLGSAEVTRLPPRPLQRAIGANGCSADMVRVADRFCVDRFEASAVDDVQERQLSPFYPPSAPLAVPLRQLWEGRLASTPGNGTMLPHLPGWQRENTWRPRAISRAGVVPQGYVNMPVAREACQNAGKRLCTAEEWRIACRGEHATNFPYGPRYREGTCNVARPAHPALILYGTTSSELNDPRLNTLGFEGKPLLLATGGAGSCRSVWGADAVYDMVGNLDEWVDDPAGTYLGGFYSRDTRDGCWAAIDRHDSDYLNYSLGFRCCDRLRESHRPVDGRPSGVL